MDLPTVSRADRVLATVLVAVAVLGAFAAAAAAGAPSPATDPGEPVEVVVGFDGAPDPQLVRQHGGRITEVFGLLSAVAATIPASALEQLERADTVAYVERDDRVRLEQQSTGSDDATAAGGNDTQTVPWGVSRVGADAVHRNGTTGNGVVVAVLDTGIDADHPDLEASYADGVDVVNDDATPEDDHGHGTHVAGTIAAADDDQGVVGVAPGVSLYGVKVLNESGEGTHSDILAGIEWAVAGPDGVVGTEDDADIISMSLGSFLGRESVHHAIKRAYNEYGILVVAGAGDAGEMDHYDDTVMAPARYDEVVAVGAVDRDDEVPDWSGFGPALELVAPGVAVESTVPGGTVPGRGTSMATPHVTGAAALVYDSAVPAEADADGDGEWDAVEVRARLRDTAVDLGPDGRDETTGFGRVSAAAAVGEPTPNEPPSLSRVSLLVDGSESGHVTVRANAGDRETVDAGLQVTVSAGGWLSVDATYDEGAGVFEARLEVGMLTDGGRTEIVVTVRDSEGARAATSVVVTIAAVHRPPFTAVGSGNGSAVT